MGCSIGEERTLLTGSWQFFPAPPLTAEQHADLSWHESEAAKTHVGDKLNFPYFSRFSLLRSRAVLLKNIEDYYHSLLRGILKTKHRSLKQCGKRRENVHVRHHRRLDFKRFCVTMLYGPISKLDLHSRSLRPHSAKNALRKAQLALSTPTHINNHKT